MRFTSLARGLGAGLVALGSVSLMGSAQAAPAGSLTTKCQTQAFPVFDWTPSVDAVAAAGGGEVQITLQLSDLPGVVPVSLKDLQMVGTVKGLVNGAPATFSGKKTIAIESGKPFAVPAVTATIASTETTFNVELTNLGYDIPAFAMNTVCPVSGAGSFKLDPITVDPSATMAPKPSATPTTKPSVTKTPTPSKAPTPTKNKSPKTGESAGKAAAGKVTYACVLSAPFNTKFDYKADISVSGARETADDTAVKLSASFSKIPGLAPVPIENGKMSITAKGSVDGKAVSFTGNSTVNAGPNEPVAVPVLSANVDTDAVKADVKMDTFRFEFGEMAGLAISADCKAQSGALSALTVGVGELPEESGVNGAGAGSGGAAGGTDGTAALPRTGGGDAMPVIALWALAFGVVGAAALVLLPGQRRSVN